MQSAAMKFFWVTIGYLLDYESCHLTHWHFLMLLSRSAEEAPPMVGFQK
jgi:hypothetical protein